MRRLTVIVTMLVLAAVSVGCTGGHSNPSNGLKTSTATPTTLKKGKHPVIPTTTLPVPGPPVPASVPGGILSTLQSKLFLTALPAGIRVTGVGPYNLISQVPTGLDGSAAVGLALTPPTQKIAAVYEVFVTTQAALAEYNTAYTENRDFAGNANVASLTLTPAADAFCALQPDNDYACDFVRGFVVASVVATLPADLRVKDAQAVLQGLLDHLVSVGG
jgi:hypothetical protein